MRNEFAVGHLTFNSQETTRKKKQELLKKKTFIPFSSVFSPFKHWLWREGGGRRVKEQTTSLLPTAGCRAVCYTQARGKKKCWIRWEMKVRFLNLACCGPGMLGSKAGQKCEDSGVLPAGDMRLLWRSVKSDCLEETIAFWEGKHRLHHQNCPQRSSP